MPKIQIKRGLKANLPVLSDGELGFCTDTKELFIGNSSTNTQVNPPVTASSIGAEPTISPKNTAFNVNFETATANIKMNGTVAVGTSGNVARADHVHPRDTGVVPTSRTVNSKALSANITLSAADVSAVPTSRTVNGKTLSSDIALSASDVSALPLTGGTVTGAIISNSGFNAEGWNTPTDGAITQIVTDLGSQHSVIVGRTAAGVRRYGIDLLDSASPIMRLYAGTTFLELANGGGLTIAGYPVYSTANVTISTTAPGSALAEGYMHMTY